MITEYKNGGGIWVDVESPTKDEVKSLIERFALDPAIADDIVTPGIKTRIDHYSDYLYLVLYFPAVKHSHKNEIQEIDFILSKNFLITVHYDTIDALQMFSKMFEVDSILKRSEDSHSGYVFYHMLNGFYQTTLNELDAIDDSLRHIEDRIFKGEEKKVVRDLQVLSRDLIHFKQTIGAHEEALQSFETGAKRLFGEEYVHFINGILASYQKIYREIKYKREFLIELRETNDSLLNAKQNEITRIFTMLAFFTFPLSLIVGIFALPTESKPIIGLPHDFLIILGLLGIILVGMIFYFKNKKWM